MIAVLVLALPVVDGVLIGVHWWRTRAPRVPFWAGHTRPDVFGR